MELTFYRYLRPISRFPSLQAVKEQVDPDAAAVEMYFRGNHREEAGPCGSSA